MTRLAPRALALLLLATALVAFPAATSTAVGPSVSVADMRFSPATVRVAPGGTVTWSFGDPMSHTTTSLQGFWDSGPKASGQSYAHTFASAGSFAYECSIHPSMRGTVQVPVGRTGSSSAGWTLRWASAGAAGTTYDVQVRKGAHPWKALRTHTTSTSAAFEKAGSWSVRARTRHGSSTSGWSPAVTVTTS